MRDAWGFVKWLGLRFVKWLGVEVPAIFKWLARQRLPVGFTALFGVLICMIIMIPAIAERVDGLVFSTAAISIWLTCRAAWCGARILTKKLYDQYQRERMDLFRRLGAK
jgi:hypothetical protein